MTHASTPLNVQHSNRSDSHILEIGLGMAGIIAALLGLAIAPGRAGNVTLMVWDFNRENISVGWEYGLFIAAGLLLATAFGLYATRAVRRDHRWTAAVIVAASLAVVAAAGAALVGVVWLF
jgi:hypothetical protein